MTGTDGLKSREDIDKEQIWVPPRGWWDSIQRFKGVPSKPWEQDPAGWAEEHY